VCVLCGCVYVCDVCVCVSVCVCVLCGCVYVCGVCVCVCVCVRVSTVHVRSEGGKPDLYFCDPGMKLHETCETVRLWNGRRERRGELCFTVETLVYSHRVVQLIFHCCCSSRIILLD